MKGCAEKRWREHTRAPRKRKVQTAAACPRNLAARRWRRSVAHLLSDFSKNVYFPLPPTPRLPQTVSGWDAGEAQMRLNLCLHWSLPLQLVTGWFLFQPPESLTAFLGCFGGWEGWGRGALANEISAECCSSYDRFMDFSIWRRTGNHHRWLVEGWMKLLCFLKVIILKYWNKHSNI